MSLHERVEESAAERLRGFLFERVLAAEFDARAAFGFGAAEAGALQIVGAMLDVGAKFLFHFGVESANGWNRVERRKRSESRSFMFPPVARRARKPMAEARRFQFSVSSRRRLRPAAVSS